ncbi:MAG: HD domain-containing protein [Ardenticatenaceae bacterium]|nr:HD domain-containing protein [Ardenticatenaceae bacterium]
MSERMKQIEAYARQVMDETLQGDLALAHNFAHVNRVRQWAVKIAQAEGLAELEMVQTAALLHDMGLAFVNERRFHAEVGAAKAAEFLQGYRLFNDAEITAICEAIRCHTRLAGGGRLGVILRDSDALDLLGAVGILRGCISMYQWQEYDPAQVKGETWGISAEGMTARFQAGLGSGPTIVDHLNFQISCYENLQTEAARAWGRPLADYLRNFILQLEWEVSASLSRSKSL